MLFKKSDILRVGSIVAVCVAHALRYYFQPRITVLSGSKRAVFPIKIGHCFKSLFADKI